MDFAVQFKNVVKNYGEFQAVRGVTFDIPAGGIFALLGPNGAGKTTLIKLLMGMLRATSGDLTVGGLSAFNQSVEVKRIVGYLPDEPVFYDFMRGRDIVRFVGEMHGLDLATIVSRSAVLAERLSLADAMEEFAENYSRGMKKKLGLMCALLHEPLLVVLDEPTNGLDPHGTMVLHDLMREIAGAGRTVLFSTHLLDQAQRLCSHVAVINHGQLAAEGTLAELQSQFGASESLESLFFRLTESAAANPVEQASLEGARS
ncbi:MAG TPA: ABC transporter ATP-binding protein [Lacipirellulaceae bacterium]|jgi:ABC-type multidrug transport system ATPase subunit|nr:ABC transporter ATP-binding protein [Lacipirellulaceae bacterium]